MKKHLMIAGGIVAVGWTVTAVYVYRGLRKIKADSAEEIAVMDRARQTVMDKIWKGEYEGTEAAKILQDYEFFKMAERLKNP